MLPAPNEQLEAAYFNNWVTRLKAAMVMKVHATNVADAVIKYRIANQVMFGRRVYYMPDVERAAEAIAQMRAERDAKASS